MLNISVCYPDPATPCLLELQVPMGTTVQEAIQASGILQRYPQLDLANQKVGVLGKLVKLDVPLCEYDRVEIYRPLIADPKVVRRERAAQGKAMRKGRPKEGSSGRT